MTNTTASEKLLISIINTSLVLLLSVPFFIAWGFDFKFRLALAMLFLGYQLFVIVLPGRRSLGMVVTRVVWNRNYSVGNHVIYAVLYSLSFSTILIWVFIPFDLLLLNLLLIQWPMVHKTGYTLHGYLSGKMAGHKEK